MNRYSYISYVWVLCGALLITFLAYSCANKGYPEGGPKDTTPPKVVAEQPASFARNFDKKHINVYFDEYVVLKEMDQKFIISPPQKKKPKVRLKGKYIQVEFNDTLRPNTTYSMDFADAIVDNNEGNPLGFYRYVFSTGNEIDTLELSGNVVNAESGEPMLNMYVFLYTNTADSVPVKEIPNYVARTDSSGFFRLTNLREADYKVVAVEDNNRDYKFTPEGEMVGFLDSLVHPVVMPMTRFDTITRVDKVIGKDTIKSDTIIRKDFLAYGPNNLYLRIFQEELTQLYMVDDARKERDKLDFIFSIPAKNDFEITLFDTLAKEPLPEDWYIKERSVGNDTLTLWIKDSLVYNKDTLNVILKYLRSDSLGIHQVYLDTTRYTFSDKKKATKGRKDKDKDKEKENEEVKPMEFLSVSLNASSEFDLNGHLMISFDKPVLEDGLKNIRLLEKVDTLYHPVAFTMARDSLKIRQFYIDMKPEPEKTYKLQVDSATIFDIYGRHNNKMEKEFKVRSEEFYGKIFLNMSGVEGNVVVQLYKSESTKSENGKRKYSVVQERSLNKDGQMIFDFLPEGKYLFRAILDKNGNGKWDTGLYLKGIQPEEIIYLPGEINVKQNFDIEQEFDLQKTYTD